MWPEFGSHPRLLMLAGVVLLLSPTIMSGFTIGAETHRYEVGYVETTDDGYQYEGRYSSRYIDEDIKCLGSVDRVCHLERTLLDGNVSIEYGGGLYDRPDYRYLYFYPNFYEIAGSENELWLRQFNSTTVFRSTALDRSAVPPGTIEKFENGSHTFATHADLPIRQLITIGDDRYATIHKGYTDRTLLNGLLAMLDRLLGPIGFLTGLVFLLEGYHQRYVER